MPDLRLWRRPGVCSGGIVDTSSIQATTDQISLFPVVMDEPIVNQEEDDRDIQPDEPPDVQPSTGASESQMTRSGRMVVKPRRFDDFV